MHPCDPELAKVGGGAGLESPESVGSGRTIRLSLSICLSSSWKEGKIKKELTRVLTCQSPQTQTLLPAPVFLHWPHPESLFLIVRLSFVTRLDPSVMKSMPIFLCLLTLIASTNQFNSLSHFCSVQCLTTKATELLTISWAKPCCPIPGPWLWGCSGDRSHRMGIQSG